MSFNSNAAVAAINISTIINDLRIYGESHKLRGLEGRILRGLDPAGMLAVSATRKSVIVLAEKLGTTVEEVEKVTNELHVGAIWEYSEKFTAGTDAAVNCWLLIAERCIGPKAVAGDLSEKEFMEDVQRVISELEEAANNPEKFLSQAIGNQVLKAMDGFDVVDGVPFLKEDGSFLQVAIAGHKAAVSERISGGNEVLYHVGAQALNMDSVVELHSLIKVEKEDRGRMVTFYQNSEGQDVIKKLYPGYGIVFNDKKVAVVLAKTAL